MIKLDSIQKNLEKIENQLILFRSIGVGTSEIQDVEPPEGVDHFSESQEFAESNLPNSLLTDQILTSSPHYKATTDISSRLIQRKDV